MYNDHCRDIVRVWEQVIGDSAVPERGLRTVWVLGALTTALEAGIARPKVRPFRTRSGKANTHGLTDGRGTTVVGASYAGVS
jgi:hypothetical protein